MATKEQKSLAVKALNEVGPSGSAYIPRARKLIEDPALVDQDKFGICGMAASTHILLAYDPVRFVDLLRSIFANEEFQGINVGIKASSTGDLLEHRLEQYARNTLGLPAAGKLNTDYLLNLEEEYSKTSKTQRMNDTKLDFIVCRSIGKLLKKTDRPLYDGAKGFSKKFAPGMKVDADKILKKGDLALTGEAVEFILREIVQVPVMESHNQSNLTSGAIIYSTINDWFSRNKGREPLIVAAVNKGTYKDLDPLTGAKTVGTTTNLNSWLKGVAPPNQPFAVRRPDQVDFDHWVLITGPADMLVSPTFGAEYQIPVWTWAARHKARLMQKYTQGHIAYLICVALDPKNTSMPLIVTKSSPDWTADKSTKACSLCTVKIGMGSRHHCRLCGKLFCDDCCPEWEMVPGRQSTPGLLQKVGRKFSPIPGPVRVCRTCYREHTGFEWMRDSDSDKCQVCNKEFGMTRWRHHCRYCGRLVCSSCSNQEKMSPRIGYTEPVRICDTCLSAGKWK